jgi:hypothetical protein
MSAVFIIRYGGLGVRVLPGAPEFVADESATQFVSEAEAFLAAHRAGLAPHHVRVISLNGPNEEARK